MSQSALLSPAKAHRKSKQDIIVPKLDMANNSAIIGDKMNLSAVNQQISHTDRHDDDSTYCDLNNARVHPSKKRKRPRFRLATEEERERANNFNDILSNYNNKEKIQEILKKDGLHREKQE